MWEKTHPKPAAPEKEITALETLPRDGRVDTASHLNHLLGDSSLIGLWTPPSEQPEAPGKSMGFAASRALWFLGVLCLWFAGFFLV